MSWKQARFVRVYITLAHIFYYIVLFVDDDHDDYVMHHRKLFHVLPKNENITKGETVVIHITDKKNTSQRVVASIAFSYYEGKYLILFTINSIAIHIVSFVSFFFKVILNSPYYVYYGMSE